MKDVAILLLAGAVVSALAWAFWHYLDEDASMVVASTAIVLLLADNAPLRSRIRARQDADRRC